MAYLDSTACRPSWTTCMRKIERTSQFKRDYKREAKGRHWENDQSLAPRHRDHALTGNWKDHRDCHVKPDLVLIYQKPDADTLQLVRFGSHSELGL